MADSKTTALDALATVADADILYVVDDVAVTPTGKKITRLNLLTSAAIGGTVEATTLTDGTATITGGDIASVGSITATTITDGTMSITGGDISSVGTLTATTITDGTLSSTAGAVTGLASATDGTATWTGGATNTLAGFASVSATTLTDGTATITGGAISTTGTLGSSTITMTQNSDTVVISHDGTDAFMKWSDGVLNLQTDEGINFNSSIQVKGKGTGYGQVIIEDGDGGAYTYMNTNGGAFNVDGSSVTEFVFNQAGANVDFRVESDTLPYAFEVDGATGDVRGTNSAISNQHQEIGLMLALLQTPVAIVGFTGTGATGATEKGYENGNGRVWTYSGGLATDKIFKGQTYVYSFDGTDSYLSTPDTDDMSFGDGSNDSDFSIGGWIEVVATTGAQRIIHKGGGSAATREYSFYIDSSEKLNLLFSDSSETASAYRTTDAALSVGWHYVTAVYDNAGGTGATVANGITIYVDGVAVASTPTNAVGYVAMENLNQAITIGSIVAGGGDFFAGDMGRLFVHPAALSAAEVWIHYENSRGRYNL